jgi:mannose-6-phosphate isomerase-like protein (cupin superfamily)
VNDILSPIECERLGLPVAPSGPSTWQIESRDEIAHITNGTDHMNKIDIAEKFSLFSDHWRPQIVAQLNGQEVKLVKFKGEFVWHHHENEDELFLVWRGSIRVEFRAHSVDLKAGEFFVVQRGHEHRTVAEEEAEVILFEPAGTRNTGNVTNDHFTAPSGSTV